MPRARMVKRVDDQLSYSQQEYRRNINTYRAYWERKKVEEPWLFPYRAAKSRCCNPNNNRYARYGGRGIKFHLTKEQVRYLWFRDSAIEMSSPSIDRVDDDKNYCLDNCRFIERTVNTARMISKLKCAIISIDEDENERTFISITDAAIAMTGRRNAGNIQRALKNPHKRAYGYFWRYA